MGRRQVAIGLICLFAAGVALAAEQQQEAEQAPTDQDRMVAQALAEAGHEKLKAKEYEAAEQLLRQALGKHPENPEAVYDLARVAQRLEKYGEATELYRRYLKLTEGEGKTQQRVMAGIYLKKLDREYGEMEELRKQVIEGANELLKEHGDDLSGKQKVALNALLTAFGQETSRKETGSVVEGDKDSADAGQAARGSTGEESHTMILKAHINGSSRLRLGAHRAQWKHSQDGEPQDVSINGARWRLRWKGAKHTGRFSNVFATNQIPDFSRVRISKLDVDPEGKAGRVSFENKRTGSVIQIRDATQGSAFYTITAYLEAR